MSTLTHREQELVALGAAIASNCLPCIEFHIPVAKKAGLTNVQIEEALRIADKVRRVPARMVLESGLAKVEQNEPAPPEAVGKRCSCSENDEGC